MRNLSVRCVITSFYPWPVSRFRTGRRQGIGHAGKNMPCPSSAMSSGRLFLNGLHACITAESARGISPRAAHRSVLEPLDSHGSCHPLKAAAFRRNQSAPPVASWPSRSRRGWPTPFPPRTLLRLIGTTRQSAPDWRIGTFGLAELPLVPFPLSSPARFSSSVRKPR